MNRTSLAVLVQIAERVAQQRQAERGQRRATLRPIRPDITEPEKEKIA